MNSARTGAPGQACGLKGSAQKACYKSLLAYGLGGGVCASGAERGMVDDAPLELLSPQAHLRYGTLPCLFACT